VSPKESLQFLDRLTVKLLLMVASLILGVTASVGLVGRYAPDYSRLYLDGLPKPFLLASIPLRQGKTNRVASRLLVIIRYPL
jgi:hypothetical protein